GCPNYDWLFHAHTLMHRRFIWMMNDFLSAFGVGVEANHLPVLQVALRALVIFFATLIIVRFADKRFLAKKTAFDFILAVILASLMALAIHGSATLTQP